MRRATSFLLLWHCWCSFVVLPLGAGCRLPPAGATSLRCCWGSPCRACSLQGAANGRLVPNTPAVVRLQQSINTGAVGAAEAKHRQFYCLGYARTRGRRRATPSGPPLFCGRWLCCGLAGGGADGSAAAAATRWGHFSGSRRPSPALATGGWYCSRTSYAHGCGCCWYTGFCGARGSSSEGSRCNKREMVFSLRVVLQEQHPLSRSCRSAVSCYGATKGGRHITWSRGKQRVDIRIVCAFAAVQKRVKDRAWLFLSSAKVDPRGSKGIVQQRVKPGHKLLVVAGAVARRLPWKRQASGLCHVKLLSPSVLLPSRVARAAPGDQPPLTAARATSAAATSSDTAGRKASPAAAGESREAEGRTAPEALNGRSPSRFFWPPLCVSATAGPTAKETAAGEGRTLRNEISPGLPHLWPHVLALQRPALPQTRLAARPAPEKEALLVTVCQYLCNGAVPAEGHRTFHVTRVSAAAYVALAEVPDSATSLSTATSLAGSAAGKATQATAAEAPTHGGSPVAEAATEAKRREAGERTATGAAAARIPAIQIAGHTTKASLRGLISVCRFSSVLRCGAYEAAARPGCAGGHLLVESSLSNFARQWLERCCSSPACVAVSLFPSFLRPLFPVPVSYRLSCPPLRTTPHRAVSVRRQPNAAATRAWQRENSRFLEGRRTEKHITATRSSSPGRRYRLYGVTRDVSFSPISVHSRFLVCFPFFYSACAGAPVVPFSTAQRIGSRTSSRPGDRSQTATLPVGASGGRCNIRHTLGGDNEQDSVKDTRDRASSGNNSSFGSKEVFGVRRVGRLGESCSGRSAASTRESRASAATVGCSSVPMTECRAAALQQGCTEHEDELAEKNTRCNNTGQKATAAVVDAAASLPLVVAEATGRVAKARAVRGTDTVENRELSALVMKAVAQERRVVSRAAAEGTTRGRTARTKDAAPARDALAVVIATADVSQSTAARAVIQSLVTPKATTGIEKTAAASAPQVAKAAIPAAKPITAETATPPTAWRIIDAGPAGTTFRSATKSVTVTAGRERSSMLRAAARTSGTDATHSYAGKNMQGEKGICSGYMRSAARGEPARATSPAAGTDSCAATEDITSASAAGDRGIAPPTIAITTPTAAAVAASGGELRTAGTAAEDRSKRKKLLWALTDSTALSARRQRGSATAAAASFRHADATETCARPLAAASIAAAEDLPGVADTSIQSPVATYAAAAGCDVLPEGTPRAAKSQACDVTPSKTGKRAAAGAAVVTTIKGRYGSAASVFECCETAAGLAAGAPFQTGTVAPQVIAAAQHKNGARQHPRASLQDIAAGAEGRREKKKSSCSSRSVLHKTTRHSSSGKKSVKRTRKSANAAASGSASNQGRRVLAIIDGSCLAFRSHYGMPEVLDGSGIPVQAILGFFRSLSGIKKALLQPSHLVVVFDSSSSRSSRLAIYDGYKGHRNETPTTLQQQFLVIMRLCHALGVCTISEDGVEADDVIASLVNRACVATRRAAAAAEAAVHAAAGGAELTVDAAAALATRTSARSGIVRSGGTALAVSASVPAQTSQCAGDVSFFLDTEPSRKGGATSAERDTSSSASFSVGGRLCENDGALLCAAEVQPPNGRKSVASQREGRCLVETDAHTDEIFDEIVVVTTDKDLLQVLQYNYMEDVQDADAYARRYDWEAYSFEESGAALSWNKCTRNLAVSLEADIARQCGSVGALRRQTAANALPTGEATPAGNATLADATSSALLRGADAAFQTKEDKRLNVSDVEGNAGGERCRARRERPPCASRQVSTLYEGGGDVRTGEQSYKVVNNIPHGCLGGEVAAESTTVGQEHRSNSSQRPHQGMLKEQAQLKKERYETERSGKQEISPGVAAASPALCVQRVKGPYVRIMQLHRKLRMVDENWVLLHYGVLPHQLRDYLALVGDASDSIRGCEGIGAVTARKLIVHANGRLKDLLNDEQRLSRLVKRNQLRSLLKFAPLLERNRQLISLDSNVESVQAFPFSQFVVRSTRSMAASRRVTAVAGSRRGKKKETSRCAKAVPFVKSDALDVQDTLDCNRRESVVFPVKKFPSGFLRVHDRRRVSPWHVANTGTSRTATADVDR